MSGGFFRGTSADQDTRFSNKQAKLLKSQKFAPELEHLVDMTKVKMDVIRPWIATRATELLGFEDEVLINFVYGLLDGKEVDGKKIQIQLTGFMEKNTGKFMKELWILLLSAQNNVSGVPQQFLDAKEEEQRKKKEDNDRITQEIQKRKEKTGRELERDKLARMDDEDSDPRARTGFDSLSKPRASSDQPEEEGKEDGSHTRKRRNGNSSSPYGNNHSSLLQRSSPSAARSNSREGHKSRSSSIYSQSPRHSISPRRRYHSPVRQSLSPVKQYRSPHRRSPHSRRRSISRSRNRSPSPYWHRYHARRRSPYTYRRSPTSLHRRSPSPVRRRSPPLRRRSPSPTHRRSLSPVHRRSPVQIRRRSPLSYRHRSPVRHGLTLLTRDESLSPIRRRSPLLSSSKYRKKSPPHSPVSRHADLYISPKQRNRSLSLHGSQSPFNCMSLNKEHINLADRDISGRPSDKRTEKRLSAQYDMERELAKYNGSDNKSPSHSKFQDVKSSSRKYSRSPSSSRSPVVRRGESTSLHGSSDTNREEERTTSERNFAQHKNGPSNKQKKDSHGDMNLKKQYANDNRPKVFSPGRSAAVQCPATRRLIKPDIKHDMGDRLKGQARNNLQSAEEIEYGPGGAMGGKNRLDDVKLFPRDKSPERRVTKEHALRSSVGHNTFSNVHSISKSIEYEEAHHEREHDKRSKRKLDMDIQLNSTYTDSEEAQDFDKQKHKRFDSKRNISESSETDSQAYDKKETKRRRKEEKRLRKDEKRRRREERRQRRLERRAAKQKTRAMDASPSSSFEKHHREVCESDGDKYLKNSYKSYVDEAESEQKRLEIELRKKALESLRAKKSINE